MVVKDTFSYFSVYLQGIFPLLFRGEGKGNLAEIPFILHFSTSDFVFLLDGSKHAVPVKQAHL